MERYVRYYTLLVWENNRWIIAFGDYSKAVVAAELDDMCDADYRRDMMKIITTGEHQEDITNAVAALNMLEQYPD